MAAKSDDRGQRVQSENHSAEITHEKTKTYGNKMDLVCSSKDACAHKYQKHRRKTKVGQRRPSPRWWLEGRIQRKYLSKVDYLSEETSLLRYRPAKIRMKKKDQR